MSELKIIGAGLGRTGTTSLKIALQKLGFGPCYHMQEVVKHPWHIPIWRAAIKGKRVKWRKVFRRYQATVDYPACLFYKELISEYPDAKVILTIRDTESWYESTLNTIFTVSPKFPKWIRFLFPPIGSFIKLNDEMIWQGLFQNAFTNKAKAVEVFLRHNEEVINTIPADHLLIHKISEGWEPICDFLGVPVPEFAFPHASESKQLSKWINWVKYSIYAVVGVVIFLIVILIFKIL